MKRQITLFLGLLLAASSIAAAQTKTVTNADLEKFRQKRLQSEREYRENHERLGLPSPEELEQKRIADEQNLIEYSQRLETQRLERERLQAEAENQALWSQNQYLQTQVNGSGYDSGAYIYGGYLPFYNGYYNYYPRRGGRGFYNNRNRNDIRPYPWMTIPGFNQRVIRIPQPRFRNFNNGKPRVPTRGGRRRN